MDPDIRKLVEVPCPFSGYVRARYAQFKHLGQDGFTESYDPRYALAYIATGDVREAKPSLVSGCSFTDLFGTAIGVYGMGGLNIENSVVFEPLGNGRHCLFLPSNHYH